MKQKFYKRVMTIAVAALVATAGNAYNQRQSEPNMNMQYLRLEQTPSPMRENGKIPEGTTGQMKNYTKNTMAIAPIFGELIATTNINRAAEWMMFADDGKVYMSRLINNILGDFYFEGSLEGNTITLQFPQNMGNLKDGRSLIFQCLDYQGENEDGWTNPCTLAQSQEYKFTIDANGIIKTAPGYENIVIGWWINDSFQGYGDMKYSFTPMNDVTLEAPESLQTTTYAWQSGEVGNYINFGTIGDQVWIQGISSILPEAWVKGTKKSDSTIEIDSPQFIGLYEPGFSYPVWLYIEGADEGQDMTPWGDILATFTPVEKYSLTKSENSQWLVNKVILASANNVLGETFATLDGDFETYREVKVYTNDKLGKTAVPASPVIVQCDLLDENYGYLYYQLPQVSVDGNLLNPDCLFYEIFVDGKLHSFSDLSEYPGESVTRLPYRYSDNNIMCGYAQGSSIHDVGIMRTPAPNTIGVQSV